MSAHTMTPTGTPRSATQPEHGKWQRYLLGPDTDQVTPVSVLRTSGDVDAPADANGPITLRRTPTGPDAVIVLDYGRNVAGVPWLNVVDAAAPVHLRTSYSESAAWADADGDLEGSHNESGNRNRFEELNITDAGTVSTDLIQGGQRYQRIALTTPGSITIDRVGLRFSAFRAREQQHPGWFLCSDDLVNRIWYDGAYTVQLNSLPADTLPEPWVVSGGVLDADGGTIAVLRDEDFGDGTIEFDVQIVDGAAGWVLRADRGGRAGYLLTLERDADDSTSHLLRIFWFDDEIDPREQDLDRRLFPITTTRLTVHADDDAWLPVRTDLRGSAVRVAVADADSIEVDLAELADVPTHVRGTIGFRVAWLSHARFRDLRISGDVVSIDDLSCFEGPAIGHPDPLPVILDGGKRDRTVWSGDLIVQIPNVFYSTAAEPYVRGSLEFLNGYQEASGQSAARVPPIMPHAVAPRSGQTYSAVYSMHQITNVALHLRFTGDRSFARAQWPAVLRELAFDRTLLDERGLIVTDETNGLDWDWYDGPKTGAVTAYNVSWYAALLHAADLADAVDEPNTATGLRAEAAALRAAINTHLYDADRQRYRLSDALPDSVALDGNALAVRHGVAPDGAGEAILRSIEEALPVTPYGLSPFTEDTGFWRAVSPYVADAHLGAFLAEGLTEDAFGLLRRLWGHMATADDHAVGTAWELIGVDGAPGFGAKTSLAHGWGAGATAALSSSVLGVRPESAGFETWSFAPQPGDLAWAQGSVPTPHGPIEAAWNRGDAAFEMTVTVPATTTGVVTVPAALGATEAVLTGSTSTGDSVEERIALAVQPVFHLTAGSYQVTAR